MRLGFKLMKKKIQSVPIGYQLIFYISFIYCISIAFMSWGINSNVKNIVETNIIHQLSNAADSIQRTVETAINVSIKNHLRGIAENNVETLDTIYQEGKSGKISMEHAKRLAEKILLNQVIGITGYTFVLNSKGTLEVHPKKELDNLDVSTNKLTELQLSQKTGYLEYELKEPDTGFLRKKVMYMAYFEPWEWIVSVSSYQNDFLSLIDITELKPETLAIGLGKGGSAFIINKKGDLLVQSKSASNIPVFEKEDEWQAIVDDMIRLKNGKITHRSKTGNEELLFFFHTFPKLDWIIVSSVYPYEIRKPIHKIKQIILVSTLTILILIVSIIFHLLSSITNPLRQLAFEIKNARKKGVHFRANENGMGEIAFLSHQFNHYMNQLETTNKRLLNEAKERTRAETQASLLAVVFENALEGMSITNEKGEIIFVNKSFSQITGYSPKETIGKTHRILKSDKHDQSFYEEMWQGIVTKGAWKGEIWNRRKNGEAYPQILHINAIRNDKGKLLNYISVFSDLSETKLQQQEIQHQAYHDLLTGLPNRHLAVDRLSVSIRQSKRNHKLIGVFFIDIDNFKHFNNSLGYAMGDLLLIEVGNRLKKFIREQDTVGRLGDDDFLIISPDIQTTQEILSLADRLLDEFQEPLIIEKNELFITLSIGITIYPDDATETEVLIKNAAMAMYQSKSQGKNAVNVFSPDLGKKALYRMELVKEFRRALIKKEFTTYFQPKIDARDQKICGFEALVRWEKKDGNLISPGDFIPLAEETGLIVPLGRYVLESSCEAIKLINANSSKEKTIAVNLSPNQFKQPDLVASIMNIISKADLPPSMLELEITENTMMTDVDTSIKKLTAFKKKGISIAIDDFGTGYSSLYYIKKLPIDTLKIDRSFIKDITKDPHDEQIVETIILMAKKLGLIVVAEGVETENQVRLLKRFGCSVFQGYFYAKPMPLNEILKQL